MKLKANQLKLLRHLTQYKALEYPSCLRILDTEKTCDTWALSYAFRPLTKNEYVVKHEDGNVHILAKGRKLFPDVKPLVTTGGGKSGIIRTNTVSRTAMFLREAGVESFAEPNDAGQAYFIPSARWRKICPGIIDTTRFTGILFVGEHRLAVYDIKDGNMEWQVQAERSLFYQKHDGQTQATGMLFICDDDKRIEVASKIIKMTMWKRKQLISKFRWSERDRPVKYSNAPITLTRNYRHVYLTTPSMLQASINEIYNEKDCIDECRGDLPSCDGYTDGDYEDWPYRYFVNVTTDLLKYILFFASAKDLIHVRETHTHINHEINYAIILPKHEHPILRMYPEIINMEGIKFYEYTP